MEMCPRGFVISAIIIAIVTPVKSQNEMRDEFDLVVQLSGAKQELSSSAYCYVAGPRQRLADLTAVGAGSTLRDCVCLCRQQRAGQLAVFVTGDKRCYCTNDVKKIGYGANNKATCSDGAIAKQLRQVRGIYDASVSCPSESEAVALSQEPATKPSDVSAPLASKPSDGSKSEARPSGKEQNVLSVQPNVNVLETERQSGTTSNPSRQAASQQPPPLQTVQLQSASAVATDSSHQQPSTVQIQATSSGSSRVVTSTSNATSGQSMTVSRNSRSETKQPEAVASQVKPTAPTPQIPSTTSAPPPTKEPPTTSSRKKEQTGGTAGEAKSQTVNRLEELLTSRGISLLPETPRETADRAARSAVTASGGPLSILERFDIPDLTKI